MTEIMSKAKRSGTSSTSKALTMLPPSNDQLDLLSAEVEFQRALVHASDTLGRNHDLFLTGKIKLAKIYSMQYHDKYDLALELNTDPKEHIETCRQLIKIADEAVKAEEDHNNAVKATNHVIFLTSKAKSIAEKARDALKIRAKLGEWKNLEKELEGVSELSHGFSRGEEDEYAVFKGVKDFEGLGRKFGEEEKIMEEGGEMSTAINAVLGSPTNEDARRKFESRSLSSAKHMFITARSWKFSDKLNPYFGEHYHPNETTIDSMVRVGRKEFGLVSESCMQRLAKGSVDKSDEHMFRGCLGELKRHPRMADFLATVNLQVDRQHAQKSTFIIGEGFNVRYKYEHKREKERLHCPGDWIGIFEVGGMEVALKEEGGEEPQEPTGDKLVCWCEVPSDQNEASLQVDRLAITKSDLYYAAYYVNGTDTPLSKSDSFHPSFVKAGLNILGPAEEKEWASIKRKPSTLGLENDEVEIKCGVSFKFKFNIKHTKNFIHCVDDTIGLIMCRQEGEEKTWVSDDPMHGAELKKQAVKVIKLPKDTNEAELTLQYGCSLPGYYRLCYFLHEQGNRIVGRSIRIKAVRDFGEIEKRQKENKRTRLFRVYFSNRWDMHMERKIWRSMVVPRLRKFCDDRFIDFSYNECAIDEKNAAWQSGPTAVSKMLKGVRYCSPVFVGCYGEMLGLPVNRKMKAESRDNLIANHPFLSTEVFDPEKREVPTTTEMELLEALFIPIMESKMKLGLAYNVDLPEGKRPECCNNKFIFVRHPSLRSINFPEHLVNLKGVNTISNIKKKKAECKELLKKVNGLISENPVAPKYANENELTEMVVKALEDCIEGMWSSKNTPVYLDRLAIETEIGVAHIQEGYAQPGTEGLRSTIYRPVNESFSHIPARTRRLLTNTRQNDKAKTFYELLEQHCDALNNDIMLVVDNPHCGVSVKLANFMKGYIKNHQAEVELPQWGTCMNRGIVSRYFKSVSVKMGDNTSVDLLVKTRSNVNALSGIKRDCLVLYIDLRRPSQRWKVNNMCKYILRELKRTFKVEEDLPDVDADCVNFLASWLERISSLGDVILMLDGIDAIDNPKEENPLYYLPQKMPQGIRIILSCYHHSRVYAGLSTANSEVDCTIIRRKSMLTEDKKVKIIDGVAKTRGFAVIRDSVLPLITNEKTCSVGYLKAITEEIFFRGVFDNAGEFNEDKKWGCWEGGDNPDCCGGKMIRDEIAALGEKLLTCDTVETIYELRLRRLFDTVPFFDTAICCIRLARKGLGEDELRRILFNKRVGIKEWKGQEKRKEGLGGSEGGKEKEKEGAEEKKEAKEKKDVKDQKSKGVTVNSITIETEHMEALVTALEEVCMVCLGKYTLSNPLFLKSIDKIMTKRHKSEQVDEPPPVVATVNAGGKKKDAVNVNTWKGFYLQVMIEMFSNSLVSFRKAEELPFLAKYFAKTFDQRAEKKKVTRCRENILKMVLDLEMFARLTDEMLIDDLVRCLEFCRSPPEESAKAVIANFESYFDLRGKKRGGVVGGKYELLTQKEVGKTHIDSFKVLGSRFLYTMSDFFFKHLRQVQLAQELAESALMMNFDAKAFPKASSYKSTWTTQPYHLQSAVKLIVLISNIYVHTIKNYRARMNKTRRNKTTLMSRLNRTTGKGAGLEEIVKGVKESVLEEGGEEEEEEFNLEAEAAKKEKEKGGGPPKVLPQVNPLDLKHKLDALEKLVKKLEDSGSLDDSQIDLLIKFDENVDTFEENFITLPQAGYYKRQMNTSTVLKDSRQPHVMDLERLGEIKEEKAKRIKELRERVEEEELSRPSI
ncbi:hypothetical protein TL16_g12860 [Triparma laevis f. inornata]|uniref:Uncharacterized protein n=1 Tax=Triparma laevis f. inornata TaxID=1714386 RepID=A0A9W7EXN9_9STRA|nr:hypothetical protein TL16_g12860 [Triparma laevis f. inornata]